MPEESEQYVTGSDNRALNLYNLQVPYLLPCIRSTDTQFNR